MSIVLLFPYVFLNRNNENSVFLFLSVGGESVAVENVVSEMVCRKMQGAKINVSSLLNCGLTSRSLHLSTEKPKLN